MSTRTWTLVRYLLSRTEVENTLYLKVNKEETVVSYVRAVKYLGYSFYVMKDKCQLTVHSKSKAKMKSGLKELTSCSNGWGYAKRKQKLKEYIILLSAKTQKSIEILSAMPINRRCG